MTWRVVASVTFSALILVAGYAWQTTLSTVKQSIAATESQTQAVTKMLDTLSERVTRVERDQAVQQAVTNVQLAEIKAKLDEALKK